MILVTGGSGFIGLHTARALIDAGESCVLTQYRVRRQPEFLGQEIGKRAFVEQLDMTDRDRLGEIGEQYPITGVVHLAVPALVGVSPSEELRVNLFGLANLLEAAEGWKVRRLSIASSVAVYAGVAEAAHKEDMWLRLRGDSGTEAYKKAFEIVAGHYADRAGLDLINLRIGGVWGPLYHSMANLPSRAVHAAVAGRPLQAGPRGPDYAEDGGDWCYVKDCARGIALLQLAPRLRHRTYNVASGRVSTNAQLVAAIEDALPGAQLPLTPGRNPRQAAAPGYADLTRIHQDTGYQPAYDLRRGVTDYIAWLQAGNAE